MTEWNYSKWHALHESEHWAIKNKNAHPYIVEMNHALVEQNVTSTWILMGKWGQKGVCSPSGGVSHGNLNSSRKQEMCLTSFEGINDEHQQLMTCSAWWVICMCDSWSKIENIRLPIMHGLQMHRLMPTSQKMVPGIIFPTGSHVLGDDCRRWVDEWLRGALRALSPAATDSVTRDTSDNAD